MNDVANVSFNRFIDDNHHDLLNHLTYLEEKGLNSLPQSLRQFIHDLEVHFHHEELILRGAGYGRLNEHTLEHRQMALGFYELVSDVDLAVNPQQCIDQVRSAVFDHELTSDQDYWGLFPESLPKEPLLRWTDDLSTGNDEMDSHHMALIRHINRFYLSLQSGADRAEMIRELQILKTYSAYHFAQEAALFALSPNHESTHRVLLSELEKLINEVGEGRYDAASLRDFFDYWLLHHIRTHDVPAVETWLKQR